MNNELTAINNTQLITEQNIAELYNSWTSFIEGTEKTKQSYTRNAKQFIKWLQANGINQPTKQDVITFRDSMLEDHKPTTVASYLMSVKQFFKWLEEVNIYPNICKNVKQPRLDEEHKKDPFTAKQAKHILETIDRSTPEGLRDYAILVTMLTTGLRTVEVQRANIEDIRTVGDNIVLFLQGKGHTEKTQYVKLVAEAEASINEYLATRGKVQEGEPLFTATSNRNKNGRLSTKSISRIAKESFIRAGYNSPRWTAHSTRHTTATLNLMAGASIEETQMLLRHKNRNTTAIYNHYLERANNNSEERVAGLIFN